MIVTESYSTNTCSRLYLLPLIDAHGNSKLHAVLVVTDTDNILIVKLGVQ